MVIKPLRKKPDHTLLWGGGQYLEAGYLEAGEQIGHSNGKARITG
jgi:hypothetical protein